MRPYERIFDPERLGAIAREIRSSEAVALDLETAKIGGGGSVDPFTGRIRLCSLNTGKNRYVIDLYKTGTLGPIPEALNETNAVIVGQNLKFDQKWLLWHHNVEFKRLFDTFRASHILYAGLPLQHDLWSIYKRELGIEPEVDDLAASDWDADVLTDKQYDYAADDVDKLLRLREILKDKVVKAKLIKIAQIEFQAVLPEACIELNGFYLDREMWLKRTQKDAARARALAATLLAQLPSPSDQLCLPGIEPDSEYRFNLDSPSQMLASLRRLNIKQQVVDPDTYAKMTVPLQDTRENTLAMLVDQHPVLSTIVEYRGFSKNSTSFGEPYLDNIHSVTNRVHCSYFPYTAAGRYACSQPNLQQIPRAKEFRECFRAEPGRKLAICDWSNIEMRLVAEISKDKTLTKVFVEGRDAHYATASLLAGVPEKEVTKPQRQNAKPVNFGFIYGMQGAKLVIYAKANYGVTMTEGQAKKFRKKFFEAYEGIASWHTFALDSGKRMQETRTIWGRRRIIKDEKAHNEFYNSPVQGSGADGLKNTLRLVYDRLREYNGGQPPLLLRGAKIGPIHMVHDEVILEFVDTPEIEKAAEEILHSSMIEGIGPMMAKVPVEAEVGTGSDWSAK